jgi:hypothetical protein
MKTAVLFIENNIIKVVFGNLLKCVRADQLTLDHNKAFFNKLFAEHTVVVVETVGALTEDALYEMFEGGVAAAAPSPEPATPAPKPIQSAVAPKTAPAQPKIQEEEHRVGWWIKSNAKATIIIDDIYTGQDIPDVPGAKKALAVPYNRPVNLAEYDLEQVKKSTYLRKLLGNQTLVPCSPAEAEILEREYWRQQEADESVKDADLDKILVKPGKRAIDLVDGDDDDGTTIDLTEDARTGDTSTEYDDILKTMRKTAEPQPAVGGGGSFTLMEQVALAEAEQPRQRPNLHRQRAEADPTARAQGFKRAHR